MANVISVKPLAFLASVYVSIHNILILTSLLLLEIGKPVSGGFRYWRAMQYLFPVLRWRLFIVCSSQVTEKEREFAAGAAKQLEYQQLEDDKLSQKSSSSKLSRSPLKIVKKPKSMQCKVILLDGSEYACDVEVSAHLKTFFFVPDTENWRLLA